MTDRGDSDITDGPTREPGSARHYADEEDAGVPSPFVGAPDEEDGQPLNAAAATTYPRLAADEPDLLRQDLESAIIESPPPLVEVVAPPPPLAMPVADLEPEPEPATVALTDAVSQPVAPAVEPVIEPAPAAPVAAPADLPAISRAPCFVPADPRDEDDAADAADAEMPSSQVPSDPAVAPPDAWDLLAAEPEDAPAAVLPLGEADDEVEPEPVVLDESSDDEPADAAAMTPVESVVAGPSVEEVGDGPVTVTPATPLTYETLEADAVAAVAAGRADRWTIPMLCAGICLIACCLLIPAADANRRLAYERQQLQLDLDSLRKQVEVNDRFLSKVAEDPNLAERLAQRQLKIVRAGTKVLQLPDVGGDEMSPYHLVAVTPPPPLPAYQPKGGLIARLCYNPRSRLYLIGVGMLMIAAGLVMGAQSKK